jgi:hypothetical protein
VGLEGGPELLVSQDLAPLPPRDDELARGDVFLQAGMRSVLESDLDLALATDLVEQPDLEHGVVGAALLAIRVPASDLDLMALHRPRR